jgi:hypothetical protein
MKFFLIVFTISAYFLQRCITYNLRRKWIKDDEGYSRAFNEEPYSEIESDDDNMILIDKK